MRSLQVISRDYAEDYATTLNFQQSLVDAKIKDSAFADTVVFVEHDHVFTKGRSSEFQIPSPEILGREIKCFEVSRGGQATYHGPGQLVAYPIFDLNHHGKDVHVLLRKLEEVCIKTLEKFDVVGFRKEGLTGVWVKDVTETERKICSIGIGVKKWISYHGLALNISNDMKYFRSMIPCGLDGEVMTSLERILAERGKKTPGIREVQNSMTQVFCEEFGFDQEGILSKETKSPGLHRPSWLKVKVPSNSATFNETDKVVRDLRLTTVCEEAKCPNIGECWSHHTATFMIMGELCTRRCSFCSVKDGTMGSLDPLDPFEPLRVGQAVESLGLDHVVITSVNRDDLADMGAEHFNQTVKAIKHLVKDCKIELLIPDMRGKRELLEMILKSGMVKVLNHNLETVPELYREVRPGANFKRSLNILAWAKELHPTIKTKSGIMLGLGEKKEDVLSVMDELRKVNCDILTIGQYLQPTEKQLPIKQYIAPEEFEYYRQVGLEKGFSYVESGSFVRSSYHAWKHSAETNNQELSDSHSIAV